MGVSVSWMPSARLHICADLSASAASGREQAMSVKEDSVYAEVCESRQKGEVHTGQVGSHVGDFVPR